MKGLRKIAAIALSLIMVQSAAVVSSAVVSAVDSSGTYANDIAIEGVDNYEATGVTAANNTDIVSSVKLNKSSIILGVSESYTLSKSVTPSNAKTDYSWLSSNTKVAVVSNGKITATGAGTANITVKTANGKKASCKVTVKKAPTKISLNKTKLTVGVGEKFDFNSSLPSGQGAYSIKYTSSNKSVADVKASGGLMTAKKAGTATITVTTYNGKKASCKVTVTSIGTAKTLSSTCKYNGKIYVSTYRGGEIVNNSITKQLPASIREKAGYFTFSDGYIYYLQNGGGTSPYAMKLYRCKTDGTSSELLVSDYCNNNGFSGSVLYKNKLFYESYKEVGNRERFGVKCLDLKTKKTRTINTIRAIPTNAIYKNKLYYTTIDNNLYSFNLDTEKSEYIASGIGDPCCADGNYIYSATYNKQVYRFNINTRKIEYIPRAAGSYGGFVVKDNIMYYPSCSSNDYRHHMIYSYNIGTKKDNLIKEFPNTSGVHYLSIESGYLKYMVGKNTVHGYNTDEYLTNIDNKKTYLISKSYTSVF